MAIRVHGRRHRMKERGRRTCASPDLFACWRAQDTPALDGESTPLLDAEDIAIDGVAAFDGRDDLAAPVGQRGKLALDEVRGPDEVMRAPLGHAAWLVRLADNEIRDIDPDALRVEVLARHHPVIHRAGRADERDGYPAFGVIRHPLRAVGVSRIRHLERTILAVEPFAGVALGLRDSQQPAQWRNGHRDARRQKQDENRQPPHPRLRQERAHPH